MLDARTTVAQELQDSRWVVRARVVSADYHWADEGPSWTTYTLRVIENFKAPAPDAIRLFTYRDSGGFYLDEDSSLPDLDSDYLLFLAARPLAPTDPLAAKDSFTVNYACGQSKKWAETTDEERRVLVAAARR